MAKPFMIVALDAARQASEVIKKHYQQSLSLHEKRKGDYQTIADIQAEVKIREIIHQEYPRHSFLAEEQGSFVGASLSAETYLWLIDPLDGTANFIRGIPFFSISIALIKGFEVVLGLVYNPITGEIFLAERDTGAFLNGQKITISSQATLSRAIFSQSFDHDADKKTDNLRNINKVYLASEGFRMFHSTALELCYVASGRTDAHLVTGANSWDIAAGALIVEEAGGKVTTFEGAAWDYRLPRIIASNGLLHQELLDRLGKT